MQITVIAHPRAKHPRIGKDIEGRLHAYVTAPAIKGKANAAILDMVADYLKIKKNKIILLTGSLNKNKIFEIIE